MKLKPMIWISSLLAALALPASSSETEKVDMAAMMAAAKKYTAVGDNHKVLERFLGEWEIETTVLMAGAKPEKGTANFRWLIDGRWMLAESNGTMMGMPMRTFSIIGYDNFKMSFVSASVNSFDTALATAEGDLDPSGQALLSYGTIDEYLTGEHDKMVKYIWRFLGKDEMVLEVHDLPIGENNTKVVEIRYRRRA
jgi:Protein of unknown function (DUF1579)